MVHARSKPESAPVECVDWTAGASVEPILPSGGSYTPPERPGHGQAFMPGSLAEYTPAG